MQNQEPCAKCNTDHQTFGVNPKTDDLFVQCLICNNRGQDGETEQQAVNRWNIKQTAMRNQLELAL
jgi:hypothetical protein